MKKVIRREENLDTIYSDEVTVNKIYIYKSDATIYKASSINDKYSFCLLNSCYGGAVGTFSTLKELIERALYDCSKYNKDRVFEFDDISEMCKWLEGNKTS